MRPLLLLILAVAACDPVWGTRVKLRDPAQRPIDGATLAVACGDGTQYASYASMATRSKRDGTAQLARIGGRWPVGCDLYIAKPGVRTHHISYAELCPNGPEHCARYFELDVVLEPD